MKSALALSAMLVTGTLAFLPTASVAAMLTAENGMTLYTYDKDSNGTSACYGKCAKLWPPYLAKKGMQMGPGWATVKRKGGAEQWTYNGKPLYFYNQDKKKGDAKGEGLGGVWHTVST